MHIHLIGSHELVDLRLRRMALRATLVTRSQFRVDYLCQRGAV
jgi:hypothetical protein